MTGDVPVAGLLTKEPIPSFKKTMTDAKRDVLGIGNSAKTYGVSTFGESLSGPDRHPLGAVPRSQYASGAPH